MTTMTSSSGSTAFTQFTEPPQKVTRAEEMLFGDLASVVRQVGLAVTALQSGVAHLAAGINEGERMDVRTSDSGPDVWREEFDRLAPILDTLIEAHRATAERAIRAANEYDERLRLMNQPTESVQATG